jgi:hypothetical protein
LIVPLTVEPLVGDVIDTVGGTLLLVIVSDALAVCVADAPVPVIVNVVVLAGVPAATVTVRVELPPAPTLVGLNVPLAPEGRPLTDSAMFCEAPEITAVFTVYVVLDPAATVCDVGFGVMLKSLVTVPQLPNLKVPTRVCQLNDPLAPMYSCVYQNVQSSVGSMFIDE